MFLYPVINLFGLYKYISLLKLLNCEYLYGIQLHVCQMIFAIISYFIVPDYVVLNKYFMAFNLIYSSSKFNEKFNQGIMHRISMASIIPLMICNVVGISCADISVVASLFVFMVTIVNMRIKNKTELDDIVQYLNKGEIAIFVSVVIHFALTILSYLIPVPDLEVMTIGIHYAAYVAFKSFYSLTMEYKDLMVLWDLKVKPGDEMV